MKKKKIGLILLVVGLFCIYFGYQMVPVGPNGEIPQNTEPKRMNEDEAKARLTEMAKSSIRLVEDSKSLFQWGETTTLENDPNERIEVTNYEEVVSNLFTEDGRKEFENLQFDKVFYVVKKDEKYYLLKNIPEKELFLEKDVSFQNLIIENQTIRAQIRFSKVEIDDKKVPTTYTYATDIRIRLEKDNWKLDTFNYNLL